MVNYPFGNITMQDENLAKYKIVREIFHVIWVTFGDLERYQISFRQEQGRIFVSGFRLRQCGGKRVSYCFSVIIPYWLNSTSNLSTDLSRMPPWT